jgi:hypothetical protein
MMHVVPWAYQMVSGRITPIIASLSVDVRSKAHPDVFATSDPSFNNVRFTDSLATHWRNGPALVYAYNISDLKRRAQA